MSLITRIVTAAILTAAVATGAAAQSQPAPIHDRQFMFSVSTLPQDVRRVDVNVDTGFGERAFDVTDSDRPEQRFGVQAFLGHRLTFLGRVGISQDQRDLASSQQGELLYSVLQSPEAQGSVAIGMGLRYESAGVHVLLGRVAAGRAFKAWRIDGNALFEKPYSAGRDAVDLITTVGVSRRVLPAFYAGVEMIGEDLEGFWEIEEAEGGARGTHRAVVPDRAPGEAVVRHRRRRAHRPCDAQRALEHCHPRSAVIG